MFKTNLGTCFGGCEKIRGLIDGECGDNGGDGIVNFGT